MSENIKSEKMSLVPGARIRLISKAGIRYEGTLLNVDDKRGKFELAHVVTSGNTVDQPSFRTTAAHMVYGYVVFRRSELKEVQVLDPPNPWPTDSAVVTAVEDCSDSRASKRTLLLHHAVQHGNATIVRKLLAMGYDVNAQDSMGMTPLLIAMAEYKKARRIGSAIVKAILAAGADIFISNKEGKSAVRMFFEDYHEFSYTGEAFFATLRKKGACSDVDIARLIDAGCDLFQIYESFRELRVIETMLQRGLPVNDLDYCESVLHSAVKMQDVECVELLLKYGANPQAEDAENDTPLSCIHQYGNIDPDKEAAIVELLLQHGALPLSCTSEGTFQAQGSLFSGERQVVRVLLRSGLDFTARDDDHEQTALHFLAQNDNPGVVEELKPLRKELDVNARDERGATPLHWAAEVANVEMLEFLLSEGAEADAVHATRRITPLFYTCVAPLTFPPAVKLHRCAEILLQHYADPQFVVARRAAGEQSDLFDAFATDLKGTKLLVAHLAILEGLGTPIIQVIRAKISSKPVLEEHLNECRRLLGREISGSVTLLKLLTADEKKMARLLNNEDLIFKLEGNHIRELRSSSPAYYRDTLEKRYGDGARYKLLKVKAAVSVAKILGENVDEDSLVVERIVELLDNESLGCLADVYFESTSIQRTL